VQAPTRIVSPADKLSNLCPSYIPNRRALLGMEPPDTLTNVLLPHPSASFSTPIWPCVRLLPKSFIWLPTDA